MGNGIVNVVADGVHSGVSSVPTSSAFYKSTELRLDLQEDQHRQER